MKQILLTLLLLLTVGSAFSQSDPEVTHAPKSVGKNLKTNADIMGTEYLFPERIYRSYIDTITRTLTAQLRGVSKNEKRYDNTGTVMLYDLVNKNLKWSQKINYLTDNIRQENDLMIFTKFNTTNGVNIDNGEFKWSIKNQIFFIDGKQNIGIGSKSTLFANDNALEGINLKTGQRVWGRELNAKYDWRGVFHLNDSVVVIAHYGLHGINLKDGTGWDYAANTVNMGFSNYVTNIFSNIIADSISIYQATKDCIIRLNHKGDTVWRQPLSSDLTSSSFVFKKDSLMYMVNKGSGFSNYRTVSYGKPFLAAFSLKTGAQKFLSVIEGRKQQINDYRIDKDSILVTFKNRVAKYSLTDGSLIREKTFQLDSLTELKYFVGSNIFIKTDSLYRSLRTMDSTKYYIWTVADKILTLNNNLEEFNQIDNKQVYLLNLKIKDYLLITRENETMVIDKTGKAIASLQLSLDAKVIGSKLYDIQKQSFLELDVEELIAKYFKL